MASIPNMPPQPASPAPGAPATPDAVIAEIFARIIAGGPAIVPVDAAAPEIVAIAPEGEAEGEPVDGEALADAQAAAPEAMLPLLDAQSGFPVAVVTPPVAPPPAASSAQVSEIAPAPAPIGPMKAAAPAPRNAKPTAAEGDPAPARAELVAKPAIDAQASKPVVREGGKGKSNAAEVLAVDAAPRLAPTVTPVAERGERATPIEMSAVPVAVQNATPLPSAPAALPPFFAPTPPVAVAAAAAAAPAPAAPGAPAEIAVERELDLARDGAWLDRLARDIARAGSEDGTMRFRLHPQTLGHMRVELSQSDQGANVRLTVETEAARTILLDAQPRLVAEARAQGVRLAGAEVDLAGSGPQTSGDPRRQADAEAQPMIRTARARGEAAPAAGAAARSDRYA